MEELIKNYMENKLTKEERNSLEDNFTFMLNLITITQDKTYYFNCSNKLKLNYEFLKNLIFKFQTDKTFIFYISDYYLNNSSDLLNYFELHIILSKIIGETNDLEEQQYLNTLNNYYEEFKFSLLIEMEEDDYQGLGFIYIENRFFKRELILTYFANKFIEEIFYQNKDYSFLTIVNMFFKSDKKIKKFLIDFITNYDTELAWYVSNNLSLLTNLESKFLVENKVNKKILYLRKNDIDFH